MKKPIYIIFKFLFFLLAGLIFCFIIYRLTSYHFKEKFGDVKINTHIQIIKKDWGKPDYEDICFNCSGDILLKYKKDPLGWDAYIFIFNRKDSLLVRKNMDD